MEEKIYVEGEIDLRDLFKTIWERRIFILFFTFLLTILSVVYVNIKTPIYEVKSVIRIGYIGENLVENSNIIEKKLRLIFNVDNNPILSKEEGVVLDIKAVKNVNNFIEISTLAYTNEQALIKNKEVLDFLQNEYKYKIDEYVLKTELNLKNLEEKIVYVKNVNKVQAEEKIKLLNSIDLVAIEYKLKFNQEKLKEYEENINKISKQKTTNDTQNMLLAMQILNNQNLILNLQNQIVNLNNEKQSILNETIPKLNRQLEYDIKNSIDDLNDRIKIEKLKFTNNSAKNSEIVGDIQVDDNPIEPKKSLVIAVAFVSGFILAIFIVFFMQFTNSIRNK